MGLNPRGRCYKKIIDVFGRSFKLAVVKVIARRNFIDNVYIGPCMSAAKATKLASYIF
jgi:hypothetical protein